MRGDISPLHYKAGLLFAILFSRASDFWGSYSFIMRLNLSGFVALWTFHYATIVTQTSAHGAF